MNATSNLGPVEEMRAKLLDWLSDSEATAETLLNWLDGFDLPGVDRDEHTFLWLVRALPPDGNRQIICTHLAVRLAEILEAIPREDSWVRPPMVLTNLLLLCANVRRPQELADPLWYMLERLRSMDLIPNYWDEAARVALRSALIKNQIDNRLKDVWMRLVSGGEDSVLKGNRFAGWQGCWRMPLIPGNLGIPNMEAIGFGLKEMAVYFEAEPQKRLRFEKLLSEVRDYFGGKDFNQQLFKQADKIHWPTWAVRCLGNDPCTTEVLLRTGQIIVSRCVADGIPPEYLSATRIFCQGEALEIKIARGCERSVITFVQDFLPLWSEYIKCPFEDETAFSGLFTDYVAALIFVREKAVEEEPASISTETDLQEITSLRHVYRHVRLAKA